VITADYIKINKYCVNKYFKDCPGVKIAYLRGRAQILIKQADDDFIKLRSRNDRNYKYIFDKKFIASEGIEPEDKYAYYKYRYFWDNLKKYLIVSNVYSRYNKNRDMFNY
jgi:hypothetical protein